MPNGKITGKGLVESSAFKVFEELDKRVIDSIYTVDRLELALRNALGSSSLKSASSQGVTAIKNTETALKNLNTATVRQRRQTRTNLNQIRSLNSFYQQQSRLLNKLRDDYKSLEARKQLGEKLTKKEEIAYRKLAAQVRSLDTALKRTDAAAGQFNRNVGNYAKGTRLLVSSLRSLVGAFGFTSGIYLFAAAIKGSFDRVREFDKSMQNLAGILRTTRDEISDVESEIIRVAGASIKTSREVAGLAESLATLGKRGQDLINLIKPANDLSIALGSTSDEAAEFLVQNLNSFGESSDQAQRYADVIATIRTSTSLDFQRMRDSFSYLAPISRVLGEDLAYTGGIIGLLSDNGLKAENAARLLGTAQQKLAKEGISLADALTQINDAQAEGAEGLELLSIASNLFGKQAAKVGVILATNQDEIQRYAEGIRNSSGALDDLVNEQLKSLDAQIKIMDSTWERLILTIENGEGKYARFFKGITLGVTGYLEELTEVEEAQSKVFDITGRDGDGGFEGGLKQFLKTATIGLVDLKTTYDDLIEQQREFDRYFNTLGPNTSLEFLKDELDTLSEALRENNDLSEEQRKIYFAQIQRIEELYNANKQNRNELERQAYEIVKVSGHFEDFGNKIEILTNEQLRDFIRENKNLLKTIQDINEEFENQEFTSLDSLNKKLKDLKDRYNSIDIESDEFGTIKNEIEELEAYIAKITGKRPKDTIKLLEGTVAAYQAEIKKLEELRDTTATTTEEYEKFNDEIFFLERNIKTLTEGIDQLNKVQLPIQRGIIATSENPFGTITAPDSAKINEGLTNEIIRQEERKAAALKSLRQGQLEDFKDFTDRETEILKNAIDRQQELRQEAAQATQDAIFGSIQAIFDARVASVDEELELERERLDQVLNSTTASEKQKLAAQRAFDQQEKRLMEERKKREKQAFLISQGLAVAQIAIDLARTISMINAVVASFSAPPPLGFGPVIGTGLGEAYRAANIPLAITTAAAQTGLVLAQTIPAFFKGKNLMDNYEGPATWGERRKEVKIGADGSIEVSPNKTTPLYVKKDDIITPSIDDFNRRVNQPNSEVYKRVSRSLQNDTDTRTRIVMMKSDSDNKAIEMAIIKGFRKAKIHIHNPDKQTRQRVKSYL